MLTVADLSRLPSPAEVRKRLAEADEASLLKLMTRVATALRTCESNRIVIKLVEPGELRVRKRCCDRLRESGFEIDDRSDSIAVTVPSEGKS